MPYLPSLTDGSIQWMGPWSPIPNYASGVGVMKNGHHFQSLMANKGHDPEGETSPATYWQILDPIVSPLALSQASLLDYCNPAVAQDQAFISICRAFDPVIQNFIGQIQNAVIFPALADQPEAVIDFLAIYDVNVDFYDTRQPYNNKVDLVQNVILDKINKGTPARIKSIVAQTGLAEAEVVEWYQQVPPGPPYTFSVVISDPNPSDAAVELMFENIIKMKNVRSYFAGVTAFNTDSPSGAAVYVGVHDAEIDYQVDGFSTGRPHS